MDHYTLPNGAAGFASSNTQYINDGSRIGTYYENRCERESTYRVTDKRQQTSGLDCNAHDNCI
jgi:hypothetical protein